jgi:hypothetical protein
VGEVKPLPHVETNYLRSKYSTLDKSLGPSEDFGQIHFYVFSRRCVDEGEFELLLETLGNEYFAPVSAKKKDEKSDLRFFLVDLISKIVTLGKFSSRLAKSSRITGPDSLIMSNALP